MSVEHRVLSKAVVKFSSTSDNFCVNPPEQNVCLSNGAHFSDFYTLICYIGSR